MKTLVFQSFRTHEVPEWMNQCMASVKEWASIQGYEYQFLDDHFFSVVPETYRDNVVSQRHLMADYARLLWIKKYLNDGYDRVIWVDADVIILNPHTSPPDSHTHYLFCHEVWIEHTEAVQAHERINNAIIAMNKENKFLDFYIHACEQMTSTRAGRLRHTDIGTTLLTHILKPLRTPLIQGVAMLSPAMLKAYVDSNLDLIGLFEEKMAAPMWAANVCLTFRNTQHRGLQITDAIFEKLITTLMETYSKKPDTFNS